MTDKKMEELYDEVSFERFLWTDAKKEMLKDFKKECLDFKDENHFDVKDKATVALWYNKQFKTFK